MLPKTPHTKLALVAGGIGVTPFRSHIQYMVDAAAARDTVLYYCNNTVADIAYAAEFAAAAAHMPLRVVHVIAKEEVALPYERGFLTAEMIARHTPDYLERHWYLSGPPGMVDAYSKLLRELGVPERQVVRDFFPGLA